MGWDGKGWGMGRLGGDGKAGRRWDGREWEEKGDFSSH